MKKYGLDVQRPVAKKNSDFLGTDNKSREKASRLSKYGKRIKKIKRIDGEDEGSDERMDQ